MTKQVRISDVAAEFLLDEAKREKRRFLADQLDSMIEELSQWRSGDRTVTFDQTYDDPRGMIESTKPRMAESTAAKPSKDQAK